MPTAPSKCSGTTRSTTAESWSTSRRRSSTAICCCYRRCSSRQRVPSRQRKGRRLRLGRLAPVCGSIEPREQLAAAVDADLLEDRLQMILHRVARDEEPLGEGARVESGDDRGGDVALALREGIGAAEEVECLGWSCASERDGDLSVAVS